MRVYFPSSAKFPDHVDHAAGKGILYLQKEVQAGISRKSAMQVRPNSLADPATIERLKSLLRENVAITKGLFTPMRLTMRFRSVLSTTP